MDISNITSSTTGDQGYRDLKEEQNFNLDLLLEKGSLENQSVAKKICLARLLLERGDNLQCVELLKSIEFSEFKDTELYLEWVSRLLHAYSELQDNENIEKLKNGLSDWFKKYGELNPKAYYTLAICESRMGQNKKALKLCQKSLDLALKRNSKRGICYAITGLAIINCRLNNFQTALKETYNLQIFDDLNSFPKLHLTMRILQAFIYRKLKKYSQAFEVLWSCFDMIKKEKDLYTYFSLLYSLALAYKEAGELERAKVYLDLGLKSIDGKNMCHLYKAFSDLSREIKKLSKSPYDIVYDANSHVVTEKTKGKINFKNQFILLEMLRLFLAHPGRVFSKDELIETVWRQAYNPSIHDNKIYVTIKRLRKMIEPDYNKPKYIFLAKNGYYLNKDIKFKFYEIKLNEKERLL